MEKIHVIRGWRAVIKPGESVFFFRRFRGSRLRLKAPDREKSERHTEVRGRVKVEAVIR